MTGYYLPRPDTAFSRDRKQRRPRKKDEPHLDFIRGLPCVICGKRPADPAHIRAPYRPLAKPETGMGEKSDDKWTTPLCREHHDEQHKAGDELAWWASKGIAAPFALALALYADSGDEEVAMQILNEARESTRKQMEAGG